MNAFTYVRGRLTLRIAIVFIVAGCTVPPPPPAPSTPRSFSCASFTESHWGNSGLALILRMMLSLLRPASGESKEIRSTPG